MENEELCENCHIAIAEQQLFCYPVCNVCYDKFKGNWYMEEFNHAYVYKHKHLPDTITLMPINTEEYEVSFNGTKAYRPIDAKGALILVRDCAKKAIIHHMNEYNRYAVAEKILEAVNGNS